MKLRTTTFILGAGASAEIDMPVGAQLKYKIAEKFNFEFDSFQPSPKRGDRNIFDALVCVCPEYPRNTDLINEYLAAGRHIGSAIIQAPSIDEFIDNQRTNEKVGICGKIAIVKCILEAEQKSKLFFDESKRDDIFDLKYIENTWYSYLFKQIVDGISIDDLPERLASMRVISFNYDRCLAHFLFFALKNYFASSDDRISSALNELRIIYPYGAVGKLPWQDRKDNVAFGGAISGERLYEASQNIKTFTEQFKSEILIKDMKEILKNSSMIIFLGFAFHSQNMKMLFGTDGVDKEVFATAHGFSEFDIGRLETELRRMYTLNEHQVFLKNTTCEKIFHEYSRAFKPIEH